MGNRQSRKKEKIPEDCAGWRNEGNDKSRDARHWIRFRLWLFPFFSLVVISLLLSFVYIPSIFLWPTDSFGLEPRAFFLRAFLLFQSLCSSL